MLDAKSLLETFGVIGLFAIVFAETGLLIGFIHPHANQPGLGAAALRWVGIFFFTAVPEELGMGSGDPQPAVAGAATRPRSG